LQLLFLTSLAQKKNQFTAESLSMGWQFNTNNYQNEVKNSVTILLTNHDKKATLPPGGWAIYFNAVRDIVNKDVVYGLEISRLNDDLFQLRPIAGFLCLRPKASISLDYISEFWILNYTEAPSDFYFVWDGYV